METIARRRDFIAASRARRAGAASLNLQGRSRAPGETPDPATVRVGYTCSKKVGNAVRRNRAKRRLRAAAAAVLPRLGRPGWDYVLIGKPEATAARPFPDLLADLEGALARVHGAGGGRDRPHRPKATAPAVSP
ncbi:ribonuclease P protein component [Rubrimonas cliftonensis]|uniref:Ribonuclease P protein component n=1 Tax=Rubrimonas cliftonensis TaxID=89524 RepID=A0A1H3YWJ7_9RHOB|nr:ribonuclease P protein component [Rubrimonas cliftonensis]SEA15800.1 ribonuclease P protein component [Rubrimonas cliftonensis]